MKKRERMLFFLGGTLSGVVITILFLWAWSHISSNYVKITLLELEEGMKDSDNIKIFKKNMRKQERRILKDIREGKFDSEEVQKLILYYILIEDYVKAEDIASLWVRREIGNLKAYKSLADVYWREYCASRDKAMTRELSRLGIKLDPLLYKNKLIETIEKGLENTSTPFKFSWAANMYAKLGMKRKAQKYNAIFLEKIKKEKEKGNISEEDYQKLLKMSEDALKKLGS